MRILVPIKRVPDYQVKIKIRPDNAGVVVDGIKWIVNPFDEIAVEEAIRLKEQGKASEVVVVSVGPAEVVTQLRYVMAMGADSAILVRYYGEIDSDLAASV
ncbi:MAG: electron transfer flavoprotein subunit beta/FixA family protein, partial [Bdellovibrionales bacterium]|nr:electron transfer flavoprotein subunit beta/FixA family protein [Bdellovibrionales bacterium]